jgi:hypothetical protein
MKRRLGLCLGIALVAMLCAGWVWAQGTTPEAGGVRVMGELASPLPYHLQVEVGAKADWFEAGAVVIRSRPSETVLTAIVNGEAPSHLLVQVQALHPQSLSVGPLFGVTANLYQAPPPSGDTRIGVEYLVRSGDEWVSFPIADANEGILDEFQFIVTPQSGGGFQFCEWCGQTYCGCIRCSTPLFTKCCPSCYFVCGAVVCP